MVVKGIDLSGYVALVTGGSRGIGAAIVQRLAEAGANVAINYLFTENEAFLQKKKCQSMGVQAITVQADVGQETDVNKMFDQVEKELGKVDLLINNAGISLRALLTETSEKNWQRVMDTNLKGAFLCCRRALPHMINKRFGRIINIASIWGMTGAAYEAVYAASKGGLIALTKSLGSEVGPSGITVNALAPGPIETDMLNEELDKEERLLLADEIPVGRLGYPREVAATCLFLLSKEAAFINGQIITLDGGWKP